MLARAACDNLHQIIFIVQSETAAEEISRLNGDATKISPQQMPGTFYRWSEQTRARASELLGYAKTTAKTIEEAKKTS